MIYVPRDPQGPQIVRPPKVPDGSLTGGIRDLARAARMPKVMPASAGWGVVEYYENGAYGRLELDAASGYFYVGSTVDSVLKVDASTLDVADSYSNSGYAYARPIVARLSSDGVYLYTDATRPAQYGGVWTKVIVVRTSDMSYVGQYLPTRGEMNVLYDMVVIGDYLYTISTNRVYKFSTDPLTFIELNFTSGGGGVRADHDGRYIYTGGSGIVFKYDTEDIASGAVDQYNIGGSWSYMCLYSDGYVYAHNSTTNEIHKIDVSDMSLVATLAIDGASLYFEHRCVQTSEFLYIADYGNWDAGTGERYYKIRKSDLTLNDTSDRSSNVGYGGGWGAAVLGDHMYTTTYYPNPGMVKVGPIS